jgi:Tfp pilus assembly protein PilN
MKAVNLMPRDTRAGKLVTNSGNSAYVLLAGLVALVALATLWATAHKQVGEREDKVERVTAQAAAAERRAAAAAPYVEFAKLAENRVKTVTSLTATRFDWAHAMREVSRVVPADVWLTNLTGASGASGETPSPTSSAAPEPTITLAGCTRSQSKVARLMARLRTIDGVRRVALKSSAKPDGAGDENCPANRTSDPRFTLAISFAVPGATATSVDATGQIPSTTPAPGAPASRGAIATPTSSDTKDG